MRINYESNSAGECTGLPVEVPIDNLISKTILEPSRGSPDGETAPGDLQQGRWVGVAHWIEPELFSSIGQLVDTPRIVATKQRLGDTSRSAERILENKPSGIANQFRSRDPARDVS